MNQQTPEGEGLRVPVATHDEEGEDPWGLTHGTTPHEADAPEPVFFPTAAGALAVGDTVLAAEYHLPVAEAQPAPEPMSDPAPVPEPQTTSTQQWAPPPTTPPSAALPRRRGLLIGLVVAVVIAAVIAVALAVGGNSPTPSVTPPTAPVHHGAITVTPADRQLADAVAVAPSDLPTGWAVDRVSPFFTTAGAKSLTPTPSDRRAAATLGSCLGIPATENPLSPAAVLDVASPAYEAPTTAPVTTEMESTTQIVASPTTVAAYAGVLSMPLFATCFGQAMSGVFAASAASGAQVGTPRITKLTIEQWPGAHAVGVDLSAPATASGSSGSFDVHFVFITGGRVETLLTGASVGQPFPLLVTARAAYDIERRVAADANT